MSLIVFSRFGSLVLFSNCSMLIATFFIRCRIETNLSTCSQATDYLNLLLFTTLIVVNIYLLGISCKSVQFLYAKESPFHMNTPSVQNFASLGLSTLNLYVLGPTEYIPAYQSTPHDGYYSEDGLSHGRSGSPAPKWFTGPLGIVRGPAGLKGSKVTVEGPQGSGFKTLQLGQSINLDLDDMIIKDEVPTTRSKPFLSTGIALLLCHHF